MLGKKVFLKRLTQQANINSISLKSTDFEGSSPPSVFIGSYNYPKVFAGPMLAQEKDSFSYDAPESWLGNYKKEDIINFRLNLLRGKKTVYAADAAGRFAQQLQDIALAKDSVFSHAEFDKVPKGITFNEEHAPFGPSAELKKLETESGKWHKDMEKSFYDYDLNANDAVLNLRNENLPFTTIQKALSTGAFGRLKSRKLVPTRWSITATDDIIGKNAMVDVRENEIIEDFRVYESAGLNNYFSIMLTPTNWQYEAIEGFINVLDNKTFMFSDHERFKGRKEYSEMGGCYYAQRQVVADKLKQDNEQAGAFVFREVYEGYVPTGVWVCRELTKKAMEREPKSFASMKDALNYVNSKLQLGVSRHRQNMPLLRDFRNQKRLSDFF